RSVGQALGVSDDTAQKRVARALDKLREILSRRGITASGTALSAILIGHTVQAAPAGLIASISAATIAATTTTITTHVTMNWINLKLITAIVTSAVVAGTATHFVQQKEADRLRTDNATLRAQQETLQKEHDAAIASAAAKDNGPALLSRQDQSDLLRLRAE